LFRLDARDKTLGTGEYVDDLVFADMLYAKALRSAYPRARVLNIDASEAEAHPDCVRVIRAGDIPGNKKCGHLVKDWDALIGEGEITRYVGDAIVLVVTRSKESLDEVLALVKVDYEELQPVTSPAMALEPDAPLVHENGNLLRREVLNRGDADAAIAGAAHVVTRHYSLPFTEHAFMEPECAIAMPDGDDGLLLYTASQSIYDEQHEVASLLGLPSHL
ncbi:molybdopterin-dependent oxidoreductase, partial [Desulfovibrio sp. OttesenSCG-928-F20]|nr:molybdopterin-dependent oxidoreductase [Desulfovibrio sp. OttesenSCG-928-F20]